MDGAAAREKRAQVTVACQNCRTRKTKCDGLRPVCQPCHLAKRDCSYDADPDAAPIIRVKRKYEALLAKSTDEHQLLDLLQSISDTSVLQVLTHLRSGRDSGSALALARNLPVRFGADMRSTGSQDADNLPASPMEASYERSPALARNGKRALPVPEYEVQHTAEPFAVDPRALPPLHSLRLLQHGPALPETEVFRCNWLPMILDRDYFMTTVYIPSIREPGPVLTAHTSTDFGNLPFSSAIQANHNPTNVQSAQQRNLTVPVWAMRSINGAAPSVDPFAAILADLEVDLAHGMHEQELCGSHAYVSALDNEAVYRVAPKLSQITARIVHSIKLGERVSKITQYALMHSYWALMRWVLFPSAESYLAVPSLMRPTPYQLFVAHPRTFDFCILPGLRDLMCQSEVHDVRWLTEGARTIECREMPLEESRYPRVAALPKSAEMSLRMLCFDGKTGQLDLNTAYKDYIKLEENWSFGPSVRPFLRDADRYIRIRPF